MLPITKCLVCQFLLHHHTKFKMAPNNKSAAKRKKMRETFICKFIYKPCLIKWWVRLKFKQLFIRPCLECRISHGILFPLERNVRLFEVLWIQRGVEMLPSSTLRTSAAWDPGWHWSPCTHREKAIHQNWIPVCTNLQSRGGSCEKVRSDYPE